MTLKHFAIALAALLVVAANTNAQTFTNLHNFAYSPDGANPVSPVIVSSNTVYGTTQYGGAEYGGLGYGTVFSVNTNGTGYKVLYSFDPYTSDGGNTFGGLTIASNTLYGTTWQYGSAGAGTVFKVNTDGSGFKVLTSFTNIGSGSSPEGNLIVSGNTVYGTTFLGGSGFDGTIFAVHTDGTGFTNLYTFSAWGGENSYGSKTNMDGMNPTYMVLSGGTLYGAAYGGGTNGNGVIFSINTNGTGFTVLYTFSEWSGYINNGFVSGNTNADGQYPVISAISGNTIYGSAYQGGGFCEGTIFKINTDGTDFTNLHNFYDPAFGNFSGGYTPSGVTVSGNALYGVAERGGNGSGVIFTMNTDGTGFKVSYDFTPMQGAPFYPYQTNMDGASPGGAIGNYAPLCLSGNALYGTTDQGGNFGYGTLFSISVPVAPPQLNLFLSGTNAVLTWPTNAAGFTLQSATNLVSPVWNAVSPVPVIQGGQNAVTNPVSGAQKFYRLQSN
jgi:uncharacterized repeat protein (TIGR03803 family)